MPVSSVTPATISEAELMQRTGLSQRAALKRELTRLRIRYFCSRGGVWTTAAALDAALGLRDEGPPERHIKIGGPRTQDAPGP